MADSRIDIRFVVHSEELTRGVKQLASDFQKGIQPIHKSMEGLTAKEISEVKKRHAVNVSYQRESVKAASATAEQTNVIFKRVDETRKKGTEAVRAKIFQIEELIRKERVRVLSSIDRADEINHKNRIKRLNAELQLHRSSEKKTTGGRTFTEQLEKNVLGRANFGGVNLGDVVGLKGMKSGGGALLALGGMTAAVGGLAVVAKESISAFSSYEDALADLSALTGVSGGDLDSLGDKARTLGMKFGIDAPQAIESFKLVLSALGPAIAKDQQALESMGKSVLTLAKASGADAQTATAALTTTMNQFGLGMGTPKEQAIQMTRIMNVMAAGAKEGAAEVPQLAEAMKQVGATAKEQGVSVEGAAAAIEVLSQRGINGAEAGTAYRNVLSFMASGTKEADKALADMGLTFADINPQIVGQEKGLATLKGAFDKIQDPVKKSAYLLDIFKRENQNAALVLMDNVEGLNKMTAAISGTNTANEQANTKMATLSAQWEKFKIVIGDVFVSIGSAFAPALELMLRKVNDFIAGIQSAIKWVGDLFKSSETLGKEAVAEANKLGAEGLDRELARTASFREKVEAMTAARRAKFAALDEAKKKKTTDKSGSDARAAAKKANDEAIAEEERKLQRQKEFDELAIKLSIYDKEKQDDALIALERLYIQKRIALYEKARQDEKLADEKHRKEMLDRRYGNGTINGEVGTVEGVTPDGSVKRTGDLPLPLKGRADEKEKPFWLGGDGQDEITNGVSDLANNAKSSFESLLFDPLDAMVEKTNNAVDKFFLNISSQLLKLATSNLIEGIFSGLLSLIPGGGLVSGLGKLLGFADGGAVPGVDMGKDTVPAMLRPGEFVLTPEAARLIGYDNLHGINSSVAEHPALAGLRGIGGQGKQSIRIGGFINKSGENDKVKPSIRIGGFINKDSSSPFNSLRMPSAYSSNSVNNNGQLISEIRALRQTVSQQQTVVMDMYGVHLGTLRSRNANNIGVIA